LKVGFAAGALAIAAMMVGPAFGQDVAGQWGAVSPPVAPVLQTVTLDDAHTALLVLDFSEPCASRPRCQATLPAEAKLIEAARQHGVMVVFSEVTGEPADAIPAVLAPAAGEEIVRSGPDKFVSTDLADLLRNGGISTVIVTGTAAEGAVLDTGLDAGLREGVRVVVPLDLISSGTLYGEQAVAWDFANAPGISDRAVLTRSAMIGF
jgi:nicotinamidase-related amidase